MSTRCTSASTIFLHLFQWNVLPLYTSIASALLKADFCLFLQTHWCVTIDFSGNQHGHRYCIGLQLYQTRNIPLICFPPVSTNGSLFQYRGRYPSSSTNQSILGHSQFHNVICGTHAHNSTAVSYGHIGQSVTKGTLITPSETNTLKCVNTAMIWHVESTSDGSDLFLGGNIASVQYPDVLHMLVRVLKGRDYMLLWTQQNITVSSEEQQHSQMLVCAW